MNITVVSNNGAVSCRPDTSWEREDREIYTPDCTGSWAYAPVIFVRVGKAGKCVGKKYASRYIDGVGFGALLYAEGLMDGRPESLAEASCLDHSSILHFPLYNKVTLDSEDNRFRITLDGEEIFSYAVCGSETVENAIVKASERVSLRTGDLVAVELASIGTLCCGPKEHVLCGFFCENELFSSKLKF